MMAAALVLCLMSFFIVAGSVAYASILVSTCAACVGVVRARLPHECRVNLPGVRWVRPHSPTPCSPCQLWRVVVVVIGGLHCPAFILCFGCHLSVVSLAFAH